MVQLVFHIRADLFTAKETEGGSDEHNELQRASKISNDFYLVEQRAKSKAPVSAFKLVQKNSTKFASTKPVTGVLLTQDPPAAKPLGKKKLSQKLEQKTEASSRAIQSWRTQQSKEKEPGIFDGYQDKNYF